MCNGLGHIRRDRRDMSQSVALSHRRSRADCLNRNTRMGNSQWSVGLVLHQQNPVVEFGKRAISNRAARGGSKPETFDFLGFTHICSQWRKGGLQLGRHTRRDRQQREAAGTHRGPPAALRAGTRTPLSNGDGWAVWFEATSYIAPSLTITAPSWHLATMSSNSGFAPCAGAARRIARHGQTWTDTDRQADRWLPKPRISHRWPSRRFRVKHPRWEPYAGIPSIRHCARGHPVMGVPTAIKAAYLGRPDR